MDAVHGKTHSPSCVVSCAAVVTVGVECGVVVVVVVVVRAMEEAVVEEGVVKALVLEGFVEEAVVDVPGAAAWGVEMTTGGGGKPYTAIDCVHGSVGHSWPWTSWAQSRQDKRSSGMERLSLVLPRKPSKSLKLAILKRPKMMPSIEGFSAVHSLEHFGESSAINSREEKA